MYFLIKKPWRSSRIFAAVCEYINSERKTVCIEMGSYRKGRRQR